jgi:cytochrome c2
MNPAESESAMNEFFDRCDHCYLVLKNNEVTFGVRLSGVCLQVTSTHDEFGMSCILRELGMCAADKQTSFNWHHAACASKFVRDFFCLLEVLDD